MIKSTLIACEKSGMPLEHAPCFQEVANFTQCVIACRSVGKAATGLILENYASKGFHVKAKSCNWGPMAGFVLSDPRFTKRAGSREARETQRKDVHSALNGANPATEFPVYITDDRRRHLEHHGYMVRSGGTINEMIYKASPKGGKEMQFVLKRTMSGPGAGPLQLWAVCYGQAEVALPSSPTAPNRATSKSDLLPVMALVDPQCPGHLLNTYRSAMTGDYDLWAVFPKNVNYQPHYVDQRAVPGSNRFVLPIRNFTAHEDPHMGNMTPRVSRVKDYLNQRLYVAGYRGGDMVHHSDEAGRPLVTDVELEFIAFIPGESQARFIENITDLKMFFTEVFPQYHITFNPGWQRQLGFATTQQGNWEA
ncbi:anthrax toxin-like adenylyl cyclase domain-containing protein [Prosthecobacter sp.]|uniref:anthrax toxin-like adenylyl cyclase domain-containing protein n=1 Tax=Prosthecobacter sp. TaxID=1965333 RepID=UPI0037848647